MRMLSGVETPDAGTRREGHQVVMQYFAQDEATRLNPALSVYETMSADSPTSMVPAIRNILGGFLFSGDDVYKKAGVLSGGERTRLAVARMLLIPSNTLLLDEPTNHLDLDSKDILLEALEDYGGTLIFVSHDRYFVEKLATKIVEIGHGDAVVYPGTYTEFLVQQGAAETMRRCDRCNGAQRPRMRRRREGKRVRSGAADVEARAQAEPRRALPRRTTMPSARRQQAEQRKREQGAKKIQTKISDLEAQHRRARAGDEGDRGGHVGPRFLRQSRPGPTAHRPPPDPDVGARRAHASVGGTVRDP